MGKKFENRSTFAKVIIKHQRDCFFIGAPCMLTPTGQVNGEWRIWSLTGTKRNPWTGRNTIWPNYFGLWV